MGGCAIGDTSAPSGKKTSRDQGEIKGPLLRTAFGMTLCLVSLGCSDQAGILMPPPPNSDSLAGVSYHASFSQNGSYVDTSSLRDGVTATVEFFVGPAEDPRARNSTRAAVSENLQQALRAMGDSDLLVTLTCWICSDEPVESKSVRFMQSRGASDVARFTIVPSHAATDLVGGAPSGSGIISVSVSLRGAYVDNVPIRVTVIRGSSTSRTTSSKLISSASEMLVSSSTDSASRADLYVTVKKHPERGTITLKFDPRSAWIENGFERAGLSKVDYAVPLDTGVDADSLFQVQRRFYCRVSQLLSDDEAPAESSNNCGSTRLLPLSGGGGAFDAVDSERLLSEMATHGSTLYKELFSVTEPASVLARIGRAIEDSTSDEKTRLHLVINSNGTYLPWQMFIAKRSPTEVSDGASPFWGFRYVISTLPSLRTLAYPASIPRPDSSTALFASYRDNARWGSVSQQAQQIAKDYLASIGDRTDHANAVVMSRADFDEALVKGASTYRLIFAHSHAATANLLTDDRISFSKDATDVLVSSDLNEFAYRNMNEEGGYFFSARPLVVLNGCETGATGYVRKSDGSFVGVLMKHGASSVLATEAKVPQLSAMQFGVNVLKGLSSTRSIAEIVFDTRRLLWYGATPQDPSTWPRDPTGLLYAYYGPIDLAVANAQ